MQILLDTNAPTNIPYLVANASMHSFCLISHDISDFSHLCSRQSIQFIFGYQICVSTFRHQIYCAVAYYINTKLSDSLVAKSAPGILIGCQYTCLDWQLWIKWINLSLKGFFLEVLVRQFYSFGKSAMMWYFHSMWPSEALCNNRYVSTKDQIMACCLMAARHWLI